jgi:hypothetical protein
MLQAGDFSVQLLRTRYGSQSLSSRDFSNRAFKPMTSPLSTSFATISWSSVTSDWCRPFIVVISRMICTRWEISSSCSGVFDGLEVFCRLGVGAAFRVGLEAGVGSSGGLSGSSIIRSSSDIRKVTWQSWLDENHYARVYGNGFYVEYPLRGAEIRRTPDRPPTCYDHPTTEMPPQQKREGSN